MALIVLDASVVIAFLDAGDEHHGAAIAALEGTERDDRVLPASAYAEVLVSPMRRGGEAASKVDEALSAIAIRIEPTTSEIARAAARLRARYKSLRLPDALVLATGQVLNATRVLTADRGWPKLDPRARATLGPQRVIRP
jgi:predicted nucleic acid-binding protein